MVFKGVVFFMIIASISLAKGNIGEIICQIVNHDEARAGFSKCFEDLYPELNDELQTCFTITGGSSDFGSFVKYLCGATPEMRETLKGCHPLSSDDANVELRKEYQRKGAEKSQEMNLCVKNVVAEIMEEYSGSDSSEEENEIRKRSAPFFMFPFY